MLLVDPGDICSLVSFTGVSEVDGEEDGDGAFAPALAACFISLISCCSVTGTFTPLKPLALRNRSPMMSPGFSYGSINSVDKSRALPRAGFETATLAMPAPRAPDVAPPIAAPTTGDGTLTLTIGILTSVIFSFLVIS